MVTQDLADILRYLRSLAEDDPVTELSDGQLIRRFVAQRDQTAFAMILLRHGPLVLGVCRQILREAHDAEDAFQASFLILAKKAASIRAQESLAAWLHRVAVNVARTARRAAAQRRVHERQAVAMSEQTGAPETLPDDSAALVHEEVDRLPEKYRLVVLCYLKGKTHEEAARELGWPLGTVKGRLARARDLLRARLARRGLVLTASALSAVLTGTAATATVPPILLGQTLQTVTSFATENAVPATASPGAVALAQETMATMTRTKLWLAGVLLAAVALVGLGAGLVGWLVYATPSNAPAVAQANAPPTPAPRGEPPATEPPVERPKEVEQPKKGPDANVANGLKLSLRLDKTQTRMKSDGTDIEPVNLRFTYTNVSARPIKLDMTVAAALCGTRLEVTGPGVRKIAEKKPANQPDKLIPEDFWVIEPGKEWSIDLPFPTYTFFWDIFSVKEAGEYRIKTVYSLEKETASPLARGSWTGTVTSNEVVLLVLPADEFGPEVKGLRAKVALAKTKFEVGEAILVSYVVKNVSKEEQIIYHCGFSPNHQIIVTGPDGKEPPLTDSGKQFRLVEASSIPAKVPAGYEDAPYGKYDLAKLYDLSKPGRYTVQYVYEEKQAGWAGRLPSNTATFEVVAPVPAPKPAEEFGAEVKGLKAKVALAKNKFEVGEAIPVTYVVKNVSKEEQTIWHSGFWPNHEIIVKGADGKEPPLTEFGKQCRESFAPGGLRKKNVDVPVPAGGEDATYEKYDLTKLYDLSKPGRYTVQYVYEEKPVSGWAGRLPSNTAQFEIAAKAEKDKDVAESEPVRAGGLEFVALVPKRTLAPAADGTRDIEIALRITNVSKEQIALKTYDVIRPHLYHVSGKRVAEVKIDMGRDGTPKPSPRASLAPGASWTWEPRATLKWTNDRTGLRLSGPDGRGVAGFWMFTPLSVPTEEPANFHYRLTLEYANDTAKQDDAPLWTGKATTNPVDFAITPPEKPVGKADPALKPAQKFEGEIDEKTNKGNPGGEGHLLGYRVIVPVTLKAGSNVSASVTVVGQGRTVGLMLKDPTGKILGSSKMEPGAARITVQEVNANGKYTIEVYSDKVGPYTLLVADTAPAAAVDLTKVDRSIKKEPAYKGKPEYCLLVFGAQAKTRVWLVRDGAVLYVDHNGSGDLTEAGKRWRPWVNNPAGKKIEFRPGDIIDAEEETKHTGLDVHFFEPDRAEDHYARVSIRVNGKRGQSSSDADRTLRFAKSAKDAPIIHFGGPLTLRLSDTHIVDNRTVLVAEVGTPGLGRGTFAAVDVGKDGDVPQDVFAYADIELPNKKAGEPPIKKRLALNRRPHDFPSFHNDPAWSLPAELGEGKAKVTLSFDDWKEGKVAPVTLEVPVSELKARTRRE